MKDFKELIKIADAYGTETRNLAEKKEQQLEEGMWDDLVGGISNLAKKLGVDPATADKVANAISTQPEAKAEIEKAEPAAKKDAAQQGVDGAADATAQAGASDASKGQAPAGGGLDVTTPNLMKAYNTGGKKPMDNIKAMQTALQKAGHDPKGIDGKYGPGTFAAVKAFQTAQGLKADGQAGPNTMKALQKATAGGAAPAKAPETPPAQPATQQAGVDGAADATAQAAASDATTPPAADAGDNVDATEVPADQASAQASQQGVDQADVAAAQGQANAGVDGADQAELDAGAGQSQGGDPMTAANQAKDRKTKPKTDRQQMAAEAVNEASMNISMSGTDAREVSELVGILKNAGMEEPRMMAIKALPPMDKPSMDMPPMGMDREGPPSPCGEEDEAEYNALMDEWDNSPDPEYKDDDYMLRDLAGGINKPKKSYPATQLGDNPMSVREALWNALQEKYRTDEGSRGKKKKSRGAMEDVKTTEAHRGKKKKSRGAMEEASRGKKKKSRGAMEEASRGKKKKSRGAMEDVKTLEGSRGKKSRGKTSRG